MTVFEPVSAHGHGEGSRAAVGTFLFNAVPLAGGASGTRVVTSGVFDVTF